MERRPPPKTSHGGPHVWLHGDEDVLHHRLHGASIDLPIMMTMTMIIVMVMMMMIIMVMMMMMTMTMMMMMM